MRLAIVKRMKKPGLAQPNDPFWRPDSGQWQFSGADFLSLRQELLVACLPVAAALQVRLAFQQCGCLHSDNLLVSLVRLPHAMEKLRQVMGLPRTD